MAKFIMNAPQTNGLAMGGIGTGSVEIWPDGEFHFWQISNQSRWGGQCDQDQMDDGEGHCGALSFWVRTQTEGGKPVVRKLGMKTDIRDFTYRMFAWNKPVESIEYDGRFPVCTLDYKDSGLPCNVKMKAVAPFVPGHLNESSVPGFTMEFTLSNPTDRPMQVSLVGALEPNMVSCDCANQLVRENDAAAIYFQPVDQSDAPDCGSLCFSVSGDGENTFLTADHFGYLREFISRHSLFGVSQESFLFVFREDGCLPDTEAGARPRPIPEVLNELTDEAVEARFAEWAELPFAKAFIRRMQRVNAGYPAGRSEKESFLDYCRIQMRRMDTRFGSGALGQCVTLQPGETARARFLLTWYFPNHFSRFGKRMGHYYENAFSDALAVNRYLAANPDIFAKAEAFSDLLFRADAPDCYPEAWSVHLSTMVKDSWLIKNGQFGLWEGLGSCGFHTTDITYHDSFGLVSLFPELQLRQMRMGAAFQREDGRVHHFFTPDLEHVDNGFDRVDMNLQFVLMICRDYRFTGDRQYLEDMWPHVISAMASMALLDADGDGLPDTDTKRNTYDAWNFSGTPAYISILWLGALKAAAILADSIGDAQRASDWRGTLEKGLAALEKTLWNGRYYDLWRTADKTDGCLMTDQLDGEWFLRMAGLGGNLPDARVKAVMQTIWESNFDSESGLVNAVCPDDRETSVFTWKNCQAEACWTGIGYAFAAMGLSVGLEEIAEQEIRTIHTNQARLGKYWSHWECGAYYTRPMSSWTTLIALSGLKIDAEHKTVELNPVCGGRMPLCIPGVIAEMCITDGVCEITCIDGSLQGWTVTANGLTISVKENV